MEVVIHNHQSTRIHCHIKKTYNSCFKNHIIEGDVIGKIVGRSRVRAHVTPQNDDKLMEIILEDHEYTNEVCTPLLILLLHFPSFSYSDFPNIDSCRCSDASYILRQEAFDFGATLAYSEAVIRRQQLLLRCLGGYSGKAKEPFYQANIRMQSAVSSGSSLKADSVSVLRSITPNLIYTKHKGQAGKIAVVGGCREYTGAPYFAAISALKIGADLSHVFCTKDAGSVIKSYSPELIVHPVLEESYCIRDEDRSSVSAKVMAEVDKWMDRFDCLVVGPGLGRDPFLLECVSNIIRHARKCNLPMVIDGDGLFLVTQCLDLVRGYPLAVLTPNVNEYKRLVPAVLTSEADEEDECEQLKSLVKGIGGVTVLRKGETDLICDGKTGIFLLNPV
ncbi:hypothetical protein DM860_015647 [Cuscuta australis]|uniref:ATP-dependent (S)-NAD(P)H-hydrate dehydratase n=1 Tax=Cuscuta australis TaxID=267555 RepID=A0A328DEW3_9ASTE|nr:hypothetical protein DM860_015647 [Cuscuta australis]